MAEAHPVGFRWVMKAKERGARIIHVDPRYSRTSQLADQHVPIRAGTDIAFLGGLIHHVLETESYFRDYVVNYTNASTIINERFRDAEDLGGVFSGFDPETGMYDRSTWMYEGGEMASAAGVREHATQAFATQDGRRHARRRGAARRHAPAPALRVPDPAPALQPLHARDGGAHLRHLAGGLPRGGGRAGRELRAASARPPSATRWAGRSTARACR